MPTGTKPLPSLLTIGGIIGSIIGGEILLDEQQAGCVVENLKRYYRLMVDNKAQQYEIYPAIASSDRVSSAAANSPEKIFRQGVLVKTTDTGEWYYIGGISPYWSRGNLIVYKGGSEATSKGKVTKGIYDDFIDKSGGLGVIPLFKKREPQVWYNPALFRDCQGGFGLFWDLLSEFQGGILAVTSHTPSLLFRIKLETESLRKLELTYEADGHYYLSAIAKNDIMRKASDDYPYIYFAFGTNPVVAKTHGLEVYPGFTFDTVTKEVQSVCHQIMTDYECSSPDFLNYIEFNDIDIGAPVYTALPCGSSCSQFGLAGLILGVSRITIKGLQLVYLRIAQPPSQFTTNHIIEWAKEMNVYDTLNVLFEAGKKFKKAVSDLSVAFPQFIATAASLYVAWVEVSYEEGLKEAEERAKELKEIYEKVVNELAGKPPSITDRYLYDEWYEFKTRVENCVREIILENPNITYEELLNQTERCAEYV
ncbi:hypothetical protein [Stygiolobus caldivivus]|uniref:Uncharacterized protein n=1 Tax=Stygiolobus caldivivus TaxID=2824673 RepID=A0A8D5ZIJ4_9CREN|nr:hypothetical protein [Stygiolobus caldivivus]BCU69347.1 hypothetical protein KN1_06440 [Stygiolobus caldivivus]